MDGRRAIVEVRGGEHAFRRALVQPGSPLRVGRTSLADLVVPDDPHLAQLHWELHWDGERGEIVSLDREGGTFVSGLRVERAEAHAGAWVRAGGTDFSIFFEDLSSSRATSPLSTLEPLVAKGRLFAVVDSARRDPILRTLQSAADDYTSLYSGLQAEVEADGAPYLVRFEARSRLLPRLLDRGQRDAWGIYIESDVSASELRAHLRRLLVVTRERDNDPMIFRFYDPRVLRAFLPLATKRQVEQLFGPIRRFWLEARGRDELVPFERGPDGFVATPGEGSSLAQGQ